MESLIQYPSYVGPSKIRTLVVPIGHWTRKDFKSALAKLKEFHELRLLDITPIDSPLFTPQGFPNGRLFFDFTTVGNNDELDLFLYDFEPFRKTFVVIGLVNDSSPSEQNLHTLREKYPTIISHNLIYTNKDAERETSENNNTTNNTNTNINDNTKNIFHTNLRKKNNLETIVCDIGRNFLEALNHYYSSYKHVTLRSPGTIGGNAIAKTVLKKYPNDTGSSSRRSSVISASNSSSTSNASKRLSTFEMTTNNLKRSASIKFSNSLSSSDSKAQQRSRGRQLKILGNFQLLAGRYLDALASFTDAANILHKVRDLLWLGSALDGIAMSFILLSYLQISFPISEIIHILCPIQTVNSENNTGANKNITINDNHSSSELKSTTPRNSVSITPLQLQIQSPRNSIAFNNNSSIKEILVDDINLPLLIKAISEKILYYYELSLSHNTEYAPQVVYCNTLLKTLMLMVSTKNSQNQLTPDVFDNIIHYKVSQDQENKANDQNEDFNSNEIYHFVNRLYELQLNDMSTELQATVYSTSAEVYRKLGFLRKEAFALRLLVVALATSTQNLPYHSDYESLINKVIWLYGCNLNDSSSDNHNTNLYDSSSDNHHDFMKDSEWPKLQKKVLFLSLQITRKFKDDILSSKIALFLVTKFTHLLSEAEQQNLLENDILPALKTNLIEKYWDPYAVRNIDIQRLESNENPDSKLPIETELEKVSDESNIENVLTEKVYNPFKKLAIKEESILDGNITENCSFLVGDNAEFTCVLQNPFKFNIEITSLKLPDEVEDFIELEENTITKDTPFIIKPQSMATLCIPVIFKKDTERKFLYIESFSLSVFNLPLQKFEIILSKENTKSTKARKCKKMGFKIYPGQPYLEIINISRMAGNCLMMLDGTKAKFSMKLINKSLSCAIDHIQFRTVTNIENSLKSDYWKQLNADELYTVETQLEWLKKSCVTLINAPKSLKPNEIIDFELEVDVTCVPFDFTGFDLILEYGMTASDLSCVYMKELKVPYEVTIRKSMEVPSMDIIPLNESIANRGNTVDWIEYLRSKKNCEEHINDYALLLIDLRNSWIDGISLDVSFDDFQSKQYLVEAQHTLRVIIPIKKVSSKDNLLSKKPIPAVFKGRQFIQSGISKVQEKQMRERFWCNEYILNNLKCKWNFSHDSSVKGNVDFRKFIFGTDYNMVPVLYKGNSLFDIQLSIDHEKVTTGDPVKVHVRAEPRKFSPINLNVSSGVIVSLLLFDHKSSRMLPPSNRRILYNGSLSRTIRGDTASDIVFELIPIEYGDYQVCVSISDGDNRDSLLQFDSSLHIFSAI